MKKALTDITQNRKMKDSISLEIFSEKNILKAIEDENRDFFYYSLPINLLINAIRNPNLSNEVREYLLETAFCFLLKLFYDCKYMKSPPHSRIGLIRLINTVIGITVALENNQLMILGSIGTHPLESFYDHLRIVCNFDHSYKNIFTAVAKTVCQIIRKSLCNK